MTLRKFVAPRSSLAGSPERYIGKASAVRQAVAGPVRERAGEHFHNRRRRLDHAFDTPTASAEVKRKLGSKKKAQFRYCAFRD
ncbi:hypothetical protein [Afipia felis]|uniref:Uncharacterized protein n=2 Tax=Afipia felis TaxID=1035 RepID=A0A380WBD6_AFIFE|nr:hypothetical protein [Afipia felis]EKS29522.1 hypothetical protein HMPREF9697_02050 [Afipia felis ATCC 53690]SUU78229.1 Uncharacterised protein [Afipia felis]SUU86294.1 Uncharacterised protein [Afipia felis]